MKKPGAPPKMTKVSFSLSVEHKIPAGVTEVTAPVELSWLTVAQQLPGWHCAEARDTQASVTTAKPIHSVARTLARCEDADHDKLPVEGRSKRSFAVFTGSSFQLFRVLLWLRMWTFVTFMIRCDRDLPLCASGPLHFLPSGSRFRRPRLA
jgi:hypothetical protein